MMTEQVGASIKEARLAAGMTQKQLAEAVGTLSARNISEAERGLRELSNDELAAIAKATGANQESLLGDAEGEASATREKTTAPAAEDEDILELFNTVDPAVKKAALDVLKGETQEKQDILGTVLSIATGIMGEKGAEGNPIAAIIGFIGSEEGTAFLETIKGALDNITSIFGMDGAADGDGQKASGTYTSFLAFTFFYAVAIYLLLIGFHFVQAKMGIKPEE